MLKELQIIWFRVQLNTNRFRCAGSGTGELWGSGAASTVTNARAEKMAGRRYCDALMLSDVRD
jgi:hypothetical protein